MIAIPITPQQRDYCQRVTSRRFTEARRIGVKDSRFSDNGSDTDLDFVGGLGEIALQLYLRIPIDLTVNTFHKVADVRDDIEVRCTDWGNGHLIIRKKDKRDDGFNRRYVLAICPHPNNPEPVVNLMGWILGYEGAIDNYWKTPNNKEPAWWIPVHNLIPISYLPTHQIEPGDEYDSWIQNNGIKTVP